MMPERLVLDASVAVAIATGERGAERLGGILRVHLEADGELVVPDSFWLEATNVLARRYHRPAGEILAAVQALDELAIRTVPLDRPVALLALDIALAQGLTTYDAAYLAVAELEDAGLLTLRVALAGVAAARGRLPDGRVAAAGDVARGRRDPVGGAWSTQGAWLAELRRRYADPAEAGVG
jgi:predicted nucleic acid-binding protein